MKLNLDNNQIKAKRYSRIKLILSFSETIIFFALLIIMIFSGVTKFLQEISYGISSNRYLALLVFTGIIGIAESIINFPLDFYSEYFLEHKYNLSNQTIKKYFIEKVKSALLALTVGIPVILIFYAILINFENNWWLIFGTFLFFFSVIIGRIAPVLIYPLFYKFKQIEDSPVKEKLMNLCKKTGVSVKGIFVFDMSKNTKKANAAFTGLGKSKRIILGDTLMEKFNEDEIEVIFAHEIGHYKKRHILKLIFISTALTYLGLYLTSVLYKQILPVFGNQNVYELSALPVLAILLSLYGIVATPVSSIISRIFEREADKFALDSTNRPDVFISSMEKLAEQNLADKEPNKIIEFLFHSHPSIVKRIEFAKKFIK